MGLSSCLILLVTIGISQALFNNIPVINSISNVLKEEASFVFDCIGKWPTPKYSDSEINQNVSQIIKSNGYPVQEYDVVTADGYILAIQRIPYGVKNTTRGSRVPIMLQHGLMDSSFTYVANLPSQSLGYILADEGFDVWLTNSRGNTYGKRHKSMSTSDPKFWDFTWDEMANQDLNATIEFILLKTGMPKVFYVGHSQGGAIGFSRFSYDNELASKVEAFFALAPAVFVSHMKSPLRVIAPLTDPIKIMLGDGELNPAPKLVSLFSEKVCAASQLTMPICSNPFFLLLGFSCQNTNQTRFPVYLSKVPAGTSVKNMAKYGQAANSGRFQKYDYGVLQNSWYYGSIFAPQYDLSRVGLPVYVYYGGQDWLVDPEDMKILLSKLNTVKGTVYLDDYNHVDFLWSINAKKDVFDPMVATMKKHIKW